MMDDWSWYTPGRPIWKSRPHVWDGGTRIMWWDEPWRLMHWSTRATAIAVVTVIIAVIGGIVALSIMAPDEPPKPCSFYADWETSKVPARCAAYFQSRQ